MSRLGSVLYVAIAVCGLTLLAFVLFQAWRHDRDVKAEQLELRSYIEAARRACQDDVARLRAEVEAASYDEPSYDVVGDQVDHEWAVARAALRRAEEALAVGGSIGDLSSVTAAFEEGHAALARGRAAVLAEEATDSPPCFFNPNHGPSTTTTSWKTATGASVEVPCCSADAMRISAGADPYWRTIAVGASRLPWWQAGAHASSWAQGWFSRWHNHPLMPAMIAVAPMLAETSRHHDAA